MTTTISNLADHINSNLNITEPDKIYDRKDIWQLFDLYINGQIDEDTFENDFYLMYTRDGATNISDAEKSILHELGEIIHRFSSFPSDFVLSPNGFTTKEEFRDKVFEAKRRLDNISEG